MFWVGLVKPPTTGWGFYSYVELYRVSLAAPTAYLQ